MKLARAAWSFAILVTALGLSRSAAAADICTETVPANRFIDGFPAYAQCAGSMTGAVYSDNGLNTSTTSGGTGWVRTQGSGGYQCTELAHRYLHFRFNVGSVPNGNAGVWCDATIPTGLEKVTTPVHGDLIVFAPGSCGADTTTGHVAVIDTVNSDSSVTAIQQNSAGRSKYNMTCAACFIHAIANDGTPADGGVAPDAGTGTGGVTGSGGGGAAGRSGVAGRGGAAGAAGAAGTTGAGGMVGTTGVAGTRGATGAGGTVGATGAAGTGVATGAAGTIGSNGSTGAAGTSAATGAAGTAGPTGTAGTAGVGPGATPDDTSGGCACEVKGSHDARFGLVVLLALAFSATARRRRASRRDP